MATMFGLYPFLMKLYADGGYQGPLFRRAVAKMMARVNVEIVKRPDHAKGFVVLRSGGSSNETSAWLNRAGVSPKVGRVNRKALAFLRLASNQYHAEKTMQSSIYPDELELSVAPACLLRRSLSSGKSPRHPPPK